MGLTQYDYMIHMIQTPRKPNAPRRKKYRKPTPERLAAIALHYLGRYAASEASLRRVLSNRIRRAAIQDEAFAADAQAQAALRQAIDTIVETHKRTGAINDASFAEMKTHSLRRAGRSARTIAQKLTQKGIAPDLIAGALTPPDTDESPREMELRAARALAKKRGLGPYRRPSPSMIQPQDDTKRAMKEVATLARAGFSFDIAKEVLAADIDTLEL